MANKAVTLETKQVPSVGRIVHYNRAGLEPLAAIITRVVEVGNPASAVNLTVFMPTEEKYRQGVKFGTAPGMWQWPPYVAPLPVTPAKAEPAAEVEA